MIGLNVDKNFYVQTLGVSCVEKSVLGYLKYLKLPYECLFCESYVSVNKVMDSFVNKKVSYLEYTGLSRLQKVAENLKLAKIEYLEKTFDEMVQLACEELKQNRPLLLRAKSENLSEAKFLPWSDEHYILLYKINDKYCLLNQYPLCEYKFTRQELEEIYDGAVLTISVNFDLNKQQYEKKIDQVIQSIVSIEECYFNYEIDVSNVEYVRNAIGILKISRMQLLEWFRWINLFYSKKKISEEVLGNLTNIVENLNKLYSALEYYRFRKSNLQYIKDLAHELVKEENLFKKILNV